MDVEVRKKHGKELENHGEARVMQEEVECDGVDGGKQVSRRTYIKLDIITYFFASFQLSAGGDECF